MKQVRDEILERLQAAVEAWKSEVIAGQKALAAQLLSVAKELGRLAETHAQQYDHAARLAAALEEVERLKESLEEAGMPAGAVTRYTVGMAASAEAIRQEMRADAEQLAALIAARAGELVRTHEALTQHVREAAGQLAALMAVLDPGDSAPAPGEDVEAGSLEPLLRQSQETIHVLRAQKADLETRVEALTTELERFRDESGLLRETRGQAAEGAERDGVQQDADALADAHREIESLRRALDEQHESAVREQEALEQRLASLEEELGELRGQEAAMHAAQARGLELEARLHELDSTIEGSQAALAGLATMREQGKRLEQAFAEIDAHLRAAAQRDEDRVGAVRAALEQLKAVQGQRATDLGRDDDALQAALEEAESRAAQALSAKESTAAEVDVLRLSKAKTEELLEEARSAIAAQERTLQERDEAAAALRERVKALEAELVPLRVEHAAAAAALTEVRSALEAQEAALTDRESALEGLRERETALQGEVHRAAAEKDAALLERDEALEALRATNDERGRTYVGQVGAGLDSEAFATEVAARNEQMQVVLADIELGPDKHPLGELLIRAGAITEDQLHESLKQQRRAPDKLLGEILAGLEYTTEEAIAQAVACQLDMPLLRPNSETIEAEAAGLLNRDVCMWHACIPMRKRGERLVVAMANPLDETAVRKIKDISRCEVCPVVATRADIVSAIGDIYGVF